MQYSLCKSLQGHMEGLCACTVNLAVLLQSEEQVEQVPVFCALFLGID